MAHFDIETSNVIEELKDETS